MLAFDILKDIRRVTLLICLLDHDIPGPGSSVVSGRISSCLSHFTLCTKSEVKSQFYRDFWAITYDFVSIVHFYSEK